MKLFLASAFDQVAELFEKRVQKLKGKKVIFIENPADIYNNDKWWVKLDREAFIRLGSIVINVDLRDIAMDEFKKILAEADIIHICGGSVFYTMSLLKEKGFDKIIADFVKENKLIYTGTSAGSMIVADNLSLDSHDPDEKQFVEKLKDFLGLGLVNFLIIPHANNKDFTDNNIEIIKNLTKFSQPVIFLYDTQAVLVENSKIEIIGGNSIDAETVKPD